MPSEIEFLRNLDDDPRKPSTVDIQRAITAGRRKRLHRGVGYAGVAAVTMVAVAGVAVGFPHSKPSTTVAGKVKQSASGSASPSVKPEYTIPGTTGWTAPAATAPTSCAIEKLPVPDGVSMALVSAADPTGSYLVGRSYPKSGYQAVIWHNGTAKKVALPGDIEESLTDVNTAGTAVGWSFAGGGGENTGSVPYVYQDGKVSKLQGVNRGSASAINDAGAIVGQDDENHTAVLWPSAGAKAIKLPVPAGTRESNVGDIDEDGTTVGNLDLKVPYVWFPDGTHHALTLPTKDGKKAASARVFTIRNGWAIGVADAEDQARSGKKVKDAEMWGVRWNVRTGEVEVVSDFDVRAEGVNAQGWQIGTDKPGHAMLVTDKGTVILPELAKVAPNSNIPNSISDDGRIIGGQSDDAGDTIHAVIWRCK